MRTTSEVDDAPAASGPKPCCVCDAPGGKHCTKCKSRHYCSKACQLVDWKEGGHKEQCKQMAAEFQDRLLDELMPLKVKIKEEPAIAEGIAPAAGLKATPRLPAVLTAAAEVKPTASNDCAPAWLGTCAICLDQLPVNGSAKTLYSCCGKRICKDCADQCRKYDTRCPLCRAPAPSHSEWLRRIQKHADAGDSNAQMLLGDAYQTGDMSLKKSIKRAVQLYERAAAQGCAVAQTTLGNCYQVGNGVKINYKTAAQWYRRAAEQGFPTAQYNLGAAFDNGLGVAQSYDEAVKWYCLAAAQGVPPALYELGCCYASGCGVPQDLDEAVRLYKLAAAKGHPRAAAEVEDLREFLEAQPPPR